MKRLSIAAVLLLVILGATIGCKKKSSDTYNRYVTAEIDDSVFSATDPTLVSASGATSGGITYLYIFATDAYGAEIRITIINNTTTGTIPFAAGSAAAYYYPDGSLNPFSQAVSGSLTLTSLAPDLIGTFYFTTTDGTQVKNGSFRVKAP